MIMKKMSLLVLIAVSAIFIPKTEAARVQVYDRNVYIINKTLKQYGLNIWGTDYFRHEGILYCISHFGNSQNKVIIYQLNETGTVSSLAVTTEVDIFDAYPSYQGLQRLGYETGKEAGIVAGTILEIIGVTEEEFLRMFREIQNHVYNTYATNPNLSYYSKSSSVWCSNINRLIDFQLTMELKANNKFILEIYISAYA